jgi:REP element-mobilizing transposase RayT
MPQSLSEIYVHIVFSTKGRKNYIDQDIADHLYSYLGGICKSLNCAPYAIGGHRNHVHILCRMSKDIAISNLLLNIKRGSSKWMKTQGHRFRDFYWQNGYGIFSISNKEVPRTIRYIQTQEERHKSFSFRQEYLALLHEYEIKFDIQYL